MTLKVNGVSADASAVTLSSATPQALGTAAAGSGTAASRDDHVHAPPTLATVIAQSTTSHAGSSFTGTNGSGTATAASLTVSIAASTATTNWSEQPRLVKTGVVSDPYNVEYSARLATTTGVDSNTYAPLAVRKSDGTAWLLVQANGVGVVTLYGSAGLLATGPTLTLDGTARLKITVRDGRVTAWTKQGSAPWTPFYRGDPAFPTGPEDYTALTVALYQATGAAGTVTVQWADVSSVDLS